MPHLKSHWTTTGLKMAQVALSFGVDDLGGTNLNEKIMHDAGSDTPLDLSDQELERIIREAGYEPCLVDSSYQQHTTTGDRQTGSVDAGLPVP